MPVVISARTDTFTMTSATLSRPANASRLSCFGVALLKQVRIRQHREKQSQLVKDTDPGFVVDTRGTIQAGEITFRIPEYRGRARLASREEIEEQQEPVSPGTSNFALKWRGMVRRLSRSPSRS